MSLEEFKYFFSYTRDDSEFVLKLAKELRAVGANLWLDQLDILGGQHWDRTVEKALKSCKGMIAVLSPESVASDNVMDEVSYALDEGNLVVPVLIRSCDIPYRLRRVQYIDFTADYDTGFSQLLRALGIEQPVQPLESTATQEPVVQEPSLPKQSGSTPDALDHPKPTGLETEKAGSKSRMAKVLGAICIVTLITIVSIGVFLKDRQRTDEPSAIDNMPVDASQEVTTEQSELLAEVEPIQPEKERDGQPDEYDVLTNSTQNGIDVTHTGWIHEGCEEFRDLEDVISKGPITLVRVLYGGYINSLQLAYDGHKGGWHGLPEGTGYGLTVGEWAVPDGERIVRVEGAIEGYYISRLVFITDKRTRSQQFGGNQGTPFTADDPNRLPLRTISGWVNLRRHESLSRAITSITFHFGS